MRISVTPSTLFRRSLEIRTRSGVLVEIDAENFKGGCYRHGEKVTDFTFSQVSAGRIALTMSASETAKITQNGTYKVFSTVPNHDIYLVVSDVMRLNAKDRTCLITVKDDCYPAITLLGDPSANTVVGELTQQDVDDFLNPNN